MFHDFKLLFSVDARILRPSGENLSCLKKSFEGAPFSASSDNNTTVDAFSGQPEEEGALIPRLAHWSNVVSPQEYHEKRCQFTNLRNATSITEFVQQPSQRKNIQLLDTLRVNGYRSSIGFLEMVVAVCHVLKASSELMWGWSQWAACWYSIKFEHSIDNPCATQNGTVFHVIRSVPWGFEPSRRKQWTKLLLLSGENVK